jgi:hypothetical protein
MMNEIYAAKVELKDALISAGVDIMEYVPERVIPPVVLMQGSSNYIVPETIGNEYVVNLTLTMVSQTAMNEQSTEKLDELIEQTIKALPSFARFLRVNQPYSLAYNNTEYLSANMEVELSITI